MSFMHDLWLMVATQYLVFGLIWLISARNRHAPGNGLLGIGWFNVLLGMGVALGVLRGVRLDVARLDGEQADDSAARSQRRVDAARGIGCEARSWGEPRDSQGARSLHRRADHERCVVDAYRARRAGAVIAKQFESAVGLVHQIQRHGVGWHE
jgi:hypothetical protein